MKKILIAFFTATVILSGLSVSAKNGDIAGKIYSTDIKAYINGVEVPSYNIGGRTVVIIEDITDGYEYSEQLRTLVCWGITPDSLITGTNSYMQKPGNIVGNIYETDIKTYINGKDVMCYSLNGKMAVAIEDLGGDKIFSDIGGRYFWDENARTISLEFAYNNIFELHKMLSEKHLTMSIDYNTMTVSFEHEPIMYGSTSSEGVPPDGVYELTYNDEIVGYSYKFESVNFYVDENGEYSLEVGNHRSYERYWDLEKVKEILKDINPVQPTYEDWMEYFEQNMYRVISELETDEYHFLYMYQPTSHGSTQFLEKIYKADGRRVSYGENFESVSFHGQKYYDNVEMDEENEKVYFSYDKNYVIDLKTDLLTNR